jgi:glycosyltransferase involved in cell wall biosynthesis
MQLRYAANEHPEWSFVLIGPIHDRHIHFDAPNVHWLGAKPYMDLPAYLKYFDVAIMPFIPGEMIQSVDPVKIYEYMAAGKAIVTTELPSILPFGQALRFYKSRQIRIADAEELDNSIENEAVATMLDIAARVVGKGD